MQAQKIKICKKIQKYKIIGQGGANSGSGGVESRTNRPKVRQAQDFIPVLQPSPKTRVFASNLYLALACIKSKTHNIKNVAYDLTIPVI